MHHDSRVCSQEIGLDDMKGTEALMFAIGILGAHDMGEILRVHDMGEIGGGRGVRDVMREQERFLVRRLDVFHNPNDQRHHDVDDHRHNDHQ